MNHCDICGTETDDLDDDSLCSWCASVKRECAYEDVKKDEWKLRKNGVEL